MSANHKTDSCDTESWIKDRNTDMGTVAEDDLILLPVTRIEQGSYVAFYTDRLKSGKWAQEFIPQLDDLPHLLEIRIFNEKKELKIIRSQIGETFIWRLAQEEHLSEHIREEISFVESQFLDIDDQKEKEFDGINTYFYATGGGRYPLPVDSSDIRKVKLINYIRYSENGNMQICDFRLVKFMAKDGD